MKRLIIYLLALAPMLCLFSCNTGNFPSVYGQEEISYISVISSDDMANKVVQVVVDDNEPFTVKVQKAKQNTEKHNGKLHGIKPGRRHVSIYYNNNLIYSQEVFLSSQQTKIINL